MSKKVLSEEEIIKLLVETKVIEEKEADKYIKKSLEKDKEEGERK